MIINGTALKGIILAGGTGSRLWPITQVVVERAVPAGKLVHAILDNYATHKRRRPPSTNF